MTQKKNKIDLGKETKAKCLKEIIGFFQDERNEEIGFIAAEKILTFFLDTIGQEVYKNAVNDTRKLLREKLDDLEVELDILTEK